MLRDTRLLVVILIVFLFSWLGGWKESYAKEIITDAGGDSAYYGDYDVRIISNVTAEILDKYLGGHLKGKGSVFIDAGKANGVDPAFLAALAMHETGNGTSDLSAPPFNNVGGIKCVDKDKGCGKIPGGKTNWQKFSSVEESIKYKAELLKMRYVNEGLVTIEKIQKVYAPDNDGEVNKYWVSGISRYLSMMGVPNNKGKGNVSEGTGEYKDGEEAGSVMKQFKFPKGEMEINNVGIDDRVFDDGEIVNYGFYKVGAKIGIWLYKIAQVFSIFLIGFISLLWLIAGLAYIGIDMAYDWLHKLTFRKIDILEPTGFKRLFILTGFSFIVVSIVITGILSKLFALVYKMLAIFINYLANLRFF